MPYDFSQNFIYTGSSQLWEKPLGVSNVWIEVLGGGGAGGNQSRGGGGAYVISNYQFLRVDISYNVTVNVGGGGSAPPLQSGGTSVGGIPDPSGIIQRDGGGGTTLLGYSSGGGGGMTSVLYLDPASGNEIIKVIAGGGGGGGGGSGVNGGDSGNYGQQVDSSNFFSSIGSYGSGLGGGQGGNTSLLGNAGLGGLNGGVNGFDYVDASVNSIASYKGGGGGNGGTFAGGGGGAGYGGAAGGKGGGGGGGGSISNANSIIFYLGAGGTGGTNNMSGGAGSVRFSWNDQPPFVPPVIVKGFMLDSQHTCKSIYTAPLTKPASVKIYDFSSSLMNVSNPYSGVINNDTELYIIAGDNQLYAFDHSFTFLWPYPFPAPVGYTFFGTPSIIQNGTLYISATTTTSIGKFFAVTDNAQGGAIKWNFTLTDSGDYPTTSPVLDLSGNIFFGTHNGSIYAISDEASQATLGWQYPDPLFYSRPGTPVVGTPVFDASYNKLCYTTLDGTINVIDLSINSVLNHTVPLSPPRWSNTLTNGEYYNTPSIGKGAGHICGNVYVNSSAGNVYGYDISSGIPLWSPLLVADASLSNIAVDASNNRLYFTTQHALNAVDSSYGTLEWTYPIDTSGSTVVNNSIPIIDASNDILFGSSNGYLYSIDGIQRTFNWRYGVGGAIEAMPIIGLDGHIYAPAKNAKLYDFSGGGPFAPTVSAISPMYMLNERHTGLSPYYGPTVAYPPSLNWSADFVSSNLFVSPSIGIATDGTLYIGSNDGYVYAYNSNGSLKWHKQVNNTDAEPFTSPNAMYTTPLIGTDGTIYIGSNEGYLYALEPINGTIKWKYSAGYPLQSSPIMDGNGTIYFGAGNNVFALGDAGYAAYSKWLAPYFATNAHVNSSPALGQNGYLYFGSDDGYVYAVDYFTGLLQWSYDASQPSPPPVKPIYTSAAVDASNNVIIGNGSYMNGTLYSLDGATGATNWSQTYDANIGPFYNTVAIKGDTIYLSTIAYVYAINRINGVKLWYFSATNFYYTSPIIDASGTIFFASIKAKDDPNGGQLKHDGILHSLTDNGNGTFNTNWSLQVCSPGRLAPPVLGNNGNIYISGTSNKVYALH